MKSALVGPFGGFGERSGDAEATPVPLQPRPQRIARRDFPAPSLEAAQDAIGVLLLGQFA